MECSSLNKANAKCRQDIERKVTVGTADLNEPYMHEAKSLH